MTIKGFKIKSLTPNDAFDGIFIGANIVFAVLLFAVTIVLFIDILISQEISLENLRIISADFISKEMHLRNKENRNHLLFLYFLVYGLFFFKVRTIITLSKSKKLDLFSILKSC